MPSKPKSDFGLVYTRLKTILRKYESGALRAQAGGAASYELIGPPTPTSRGKEVWFGAVRLGKSYVSYHLMAVYAFPELLTGLSPQLKKRMQGKSCFHFTAVDEPLFDELEQLTERSYKGFKKHKLIN